MGKMMIVTVGTSLFHSASWEADKIKEDLGLYWSTYNENWVTGEGLKNPELRKKNDGGVSDILIQKLTVDNATEWADRLALYQRRRTPIMRYSAEIATILQYADQKASNNWKNFLDEYQFIFVHDDNPRSSSYVIAHHLKEQLLKLTEEKLEIKLEGITDFSADSVEALEPGLKKFSYFLVEKIKENHDRIDVIASGGFKIYGYIALQYISPKFHVIYMHEELDRVVDFYTEETELTTQNQAIEETVAEIGKKIKLPKPINR